MHQPIERPMAAVILAALLLLSGCIGGNGDDDPVEPTQQLPVEGDNTTAGEAASGIEQAPAPEPVVVPVQWNATASTSLFTCVFAAGVCEGADVADGQESLYLEGLSGNVTAASITLDWDPASPVSQTLGFGLMTMGPGNATLIDEVEGGPPLTIDASGLEASLETEEWVVHLYVWQPMLFTYNEHGYVYGSTEQPFSVSGTVTVAP